MYVCVVDSVQVCPKKFQTRGAHSIVIGHNIPEQFNCLNCASHWSQDGVAMRVQTATVIAKAYWYQNEMERKSVMRFMSLVDVLEACRAGNPLRRASCYKPGSQIWFKLYKAISNGVADYWATLQPMRLMRQNCVAVGGNQIEKWVTVPYHKQVGAISCTTSEVPHASCRLIAFYLQ